MNFSFAADAGYYSDESYERPKRNVTMAAFRDVVKNTLEKTDSSTVVNISRPNPTVKSLPCNQVDVDQHSGLRIRCVGPVLSNVLSTSFPLVLSRVPFEALLALSEVLNSLVVISHHVWYSMPGSEKQLLVVAELAFCNYKPFCPQTFSVTLKRNSRNVCVAKFPATYCTHK